jgi:Polysaccharide deacetylase
VSLEFDDATPDQLQAQGILAAHGMHGVFFVNSGRIGLNGYMTLAQLQGLAADGNEIGGHTVSTLLPDVERAGADECERALVDSEPLATRTRLRRNRAER